MPMHLMGGGFPGSRPGLAPGFGQLQQPAAPRTREVTHLQHNSWRSEPVGESVFCMLPLRADVLGYYAPCGSGYCCLVIFSSICPTTYVRYGRK